MQVQKKGFSIIEVMIGIFVFALGLTSVFMMLSGSIKMSDYSRNLIIATHLANEEIELFKNIRDSNFTLVKDWIQIDPSAAYDPVNIPAKFETGEKYVLENNYSDSANFPISVRKINSFVEPSASNLPTNFYRLYYDDLGRYTYRSTNNKESHFYRYLSVDPVEYNDGTQQTLNKALKITSTVIWTHGGYHKTEVSTVVSDWKRY